jgi:hypothetical protein
MPPKTARPVAPKMGNIKKILLLAITTIVLYISFLLLMTLEIPQRQFHPSPRLPLIAVSCT